MCNNAPMCVDYIELDFPTYNRKNRTCGTLSTLGVLMGFDGMAELNAEIVTNRRRQHPGLSLNVYCVDPGFDRSAMPLGGTMNGNCPTNERKKRNLEDRRDCTSPNGRGRRGEPQLPPPVRCNNLFQNLFCPMHNCILIGITCICRLNGSKKCLLKMNLHPIVFWMLLNPCLTVITL